MKVYWLIVITWCSLRLSAQNQTGIGGLTPIRSSEGNNTKQNSSVAVLIDHINKILWDNPGDDFGYITPWQISLKSGILTFEKKGIEADLNKFYYIYKISFIIEQIDKAFNTMQIEHVCDKVNSKITFRCKKDYPDDKNNCIELTRYCYSNGKLVQTLPSELGMTDINFNNNNRVCEDLIQTFQNLFGKCNSR